MSTVNAFIRGPIFDDNYQYKTVIVKGYQDLQSQLIYPNTKYVIKHNFDLNNESIEIPSNCIIAVDGGSLSNGTLIGNSSILLDVNGLGNTLDNIEKSGSWRNAVRPDVVQEIQEAISPLNTSIENINNEVNTLKSTVQTIQNNILGEYYTE